MALFGKKEPKANAAGSGAPEKGARMVMGQEAFCRVCNKRQKMSKCWMRSAPVPVCPCCGLTFENPAALYKRRLPACPRCGEYLEQPNFEYGLCDGCGSKYELVTGAKPGLLPNKKQRDDMNRFGKAWSPD